MRPSSISTEDFESLDFEEPGPNPMHRASSSDPLNQALPASSLTIDDAPIMPDSPAKEKEGPGNELEPLEPLQAIDSFLPILRFLPGLTLIGDTYHHRGAVSQADLQKLCAYTQRIGKFTLTDNIKRGAYRNNRIIHHGTLLRMVQLQNRVAPGPLFPSLNFLRVVGAQSSYDHLNLFLTPSLRSLEVIDIPEAQNSVLSVFLDAVADEAPDLTQITLGPGRVPDTLLRSCSKFNHLSRLELVDVAPSFDPAFLESIGCLQALEDLVLHAENSRYRLKQPVPLFNDIPNTPNPWPTEGSWSTGGSWGCLGPKFPDSSWPPSPKPASEPGRPASPPPFFRVPSPAPSPRSCSPMMDQIPETTSPSKNPIQDTVDFSQITEPPKESIRRYFPLLKKLHVIGSLALIDYLIGLVASEEVTDLALTLCSDPPITETKKMNKSKGGKKAAMPVAPTAIYPQAIEKANNNEEIRKATTPVAPPVIRPQAIEPFMAVIVLAHRKWFETLTILHIGRKGETLDDANSTTTPSVANPVFPAMTFELLVLHHTLKCLKISGWTLTSISEALQSLAAKSPSRLEILHLPIDNTSPGISLSRLRAIAEACPRLVSLQCNIKHLSNIPEYPSRIPAVNALSHGLEVLSVGNASPHPDSQRPLLVARHLNILFPNLKRIETHPGYNTEQWKYIGDLVELCQSARLDDTRRPPSDAYY